MKIQRLVTSIISLIIFIVALILCIKWYDKKLFFIIFLFQLSNNISNSISNSYKK